MKKESYNRKKGLAVERRVMKLLQVFAEMKFIRGVCLNGNDVELNISMYERRRRLLQVSPNFPSDTQQH
jgi:hypothetical protein